MDKHFEIKNWLLTSKQSFISVSALKPKNYLAPHWQGSNLLDQPTAKLYGFLYQIQRDVKSQLQSRIALTSSIKEHLYQCYQNYEQHFPQVESNVHTINIFWDELNSSQPKCSIITSFLNFYTFNIAFTFHLKQKFLIQVAKKRNFNLYDAYYSNLNTFYSKIFTPGSMRELKLESFSPNYYNWYQPNFHLAPLLKEMALSSLEQEYQVSFNVLSFFLKNKSARQLRKSFLNSTSKDQLGDFLTKLSDQFPEKLKIHSPQDIKQNLNQFQYVLFQGVNLYSSAFSIFKEANNVNLYRFKNGEKSNQFDCYYLNLLSELFFLNKVSTKDNLTDQDILNLSMFLKKHSIKDDPKANFLPINALGGDFLTQKVSPISRIFYSSQESQDKFHPELMKLTNKLISSGIIYLLCRKPLFLPSSKEKTKILLKSLDLKSHISLQNVEGSAELPVHVYIFQKKKNAQQSISSNHFHFQFRGSLASTNELRELNVLFEKFFEKSKEKHPMIFSRQSSLVNLSLDFFQDAIVDGLMMSTSHNSQQLTHPHFFQGITQKCIPLESLFKTPPLNQTWDNKKYPLLQESSNLPPFVIVINSNYQNRFSTKVDIIPGDSYLGYLKEHGSVENQYFALIPKQHDLNVSLLRYFFKSIIGQQIVDICFAGNSHHRTKIKTLLIPNFFTSFEQMSDNVFKGVEFLNSTFSELREQSPQTIFANINRIEPFIDQLFIKYPLSILSKLTRFQHNLTKLLNQTESETDYYINFYQPQLMTELEALNTFAILPKHEDIYVDIHVGQNELNLTVDSYKIVNEGHRDSYRIDLYNSQTLLVSLHSTRYLSYLLSFILKQMQGFALDQLLKSIFLPKEQKLAEILPSYTLDYTLLKELSLKCASLVEQLIRKFIINK